jgi:hypothetical protein
MKIGTDVSIAECRDSGYMVIEFKKRELIKKGVLQKDVYVECSQSFVADNRWQNGRPSCQYGYPFSRHELYSVIDVCHSWESIMEFFEKYEKEIMSMCGATSREDYCINFDNPTEYDLLHLISDVNCYMGLE